MRWKIKLHVARRPGRSHFWQGHHDPRTIDLLAITALLALVIGSSFYLTRSVATLPGTASFIVPSQSVHW